MVGDDEVGREGGVQKCMTPWVEGGLEEPTDETVSERAGPAGGWMHEGLVMRSRHHGVDLPCVDGS